MAAGARLFVRPGPAEFERYVGTKRYLVPWQYKPMGEGRPNARSFSVDLCMPSLGTYDKRCRGGKQVTIASRERGFATIFDVSYWHSRMSEMSTEEDGNGHKAYVYVTSPSGQGGNRTNRYFVRYDADGELSRLVLCYSFGSCTHHALVGDYVISYSTAESAFPDWATMDQDLAGLIDSWRR